MKTIPIEQNVGKKIFVVPHGENNSLLHNETGIIKRIILQDGNIGFYLAEFNIKREKIISKAFLELKMPLNEESYIVEGAFRTTSLNIKILGL